MGARALPGLLRGSGLSPQCARKNRKTFQKGFTKPVLTKAGKPVKSGVEV